MTAFKTHIQSLKLSSYNLLSTIIYSYGNYYYIRITIMNYLYLNKPFHYGLSDLVTFEHSSLIFDTFTCFYQTFFKTPFKISLEIIFLALFNKG